MAQNLGAQGTTFSFNGTVSRVRRISTSTKGDNIDITNLSSTGREYILGFDDKEISIEVFGATTISRATTGTATVTWNDGNSYSITNAIVDSVEQSGEVNGAITSTIVLKQTSAS